MLVDAELESRLSAIVGAEFVRTDAGAMEPWLTDWRGRYTGRARAVVFPASTEQVAEVVRLCAEQDIPMVPQGGNTGLCGGGTPLDDGVSVVINVSRMKTIRRVDAAAYTMIAEAGTTLADVQRAAAEAGRLFPLSLAAEGSCEIGGNVSTNAGGVQVLRYGNMRDLVLGIEVVLPDGRIWHGLRTLRKDNTGYDLKQLFIGAEGTLGIVTAVALKLYAQPSARSTAWVQVASPDAALSLLGRLRDSCGDRLTAFELIGYEALGLVLHHMPDVRAPLQGEQPWAVLVELADAGCEDELRGRLEAALESVMETGMVQDAVIAQNTAQAKALWALREAIPEAQKREGVSVKHDIALPLDRVGAFLQRAGDALEAYWPGVRIAVFGHLGDGNLHYNLSCSAAEENQLLLERSGVLNRIVYDIVDALNGTISAEHGLGQLKREEIRRYRSELELEMMGAIKRTLDPRGLMNPGKLI